MSLLLALIVSVIGYLITRYVFKSHERHLSSMKLRRNDIPTMNKMRLYSVNSSKIKMTKIANNNDIDDILVENNNPRTTIAIFNVAAIKTMRQLLFVPMIIVRFTLTFADLASVCATLCESDNTTKYTSKCLFKCELYRWSSAITDSVLGMYSIHNLTHSYILYFRALKKPQSERTSLLIIYIYT